MALSLNQGGLVTHGEGSRPLPRDEGSSPGLINLAARTDLEAHRRAMAPSLTARFAGGKWVGVWRGSHGARMTGRDHADPHQALRGGIVPDLAASIVRSLSPRTLARFRASASSHSLRNGLRHAKRTA